MKLTDCFTNTNVMRLSIEYCEGGFTLGSTASQQRVILPPPHSPTLTLCFYSATECAYVIMMQFFCVVRKRAFAENDGNCFYIVYYSGYGNTRSPRILCEIHKKPCCMHKNMCTSPDEPLPDI